MAKLALLGGTPVRDKPYLQWPYSDEREVNEVAKVIRSGKWFRYDGDKVNEFEKAFAKAQGASYAIAVTNGTAALEVALAVTGIGPGDEVVVPSYSFIATASAVLVHGATPVFVDIQPDTYNMDPQCFEAAITDKTKVVIPVHFAGYPADMDEIMAIAKKHNLFVLEDACHGHGGAYKGKMMGSIGNAAAFSFQASKNVTAGEGGACTTNDAVLAEKMFSRHTFGRMPGRAWYEHYVVGTNTRITEMQAAILLVQLSRMAQQNKERLANVAILEKCIGGHPEELGLMRSNSTTAEKRSVHLYMFKYLGGGALAGISRETFAKAMAAEGVRVDTGYAVPLYKQAMFAHTPWGGQQTAAYDQLYQPVVEKAVTESLWIVQQAFVGNSCQVDDIAAGIDKIINNADELRRYDN